MNDLERHHRIALARELTAAAGYPLRDRYGFAASDDTVRIIVSIVFANPTDNMAVSGIGAANMLGEIEIAEAGFDSPTDEEYELGIVQALRPLIEDRRNAAGRALQ